MIGFGAKICVGLVLISLISSSLAQQNQCTVRTRRSQDGRVSMVQTTDTHYVVMTETHEYYINGDRADVYDSNRRLERTTYANVRNRRDYQQAMERLRDRPASVEYVDNRVYIDRKSGVQRVYVTDDGVILTREPRVYLNVQTVDGPVHVIRGHRDELSHIMIIRQTCEYEVVETRSNRALANHVEQYDRIVEDHPRPRPRNRQSPRPRGPEGPYNQSPRYSRYIY